MLHLEVLFTPAEFRQLSGTDLGGTTCVVFDVLRATSTMLEALGNGAAGIRPAADIPSALELKRHHPGALLAGERDGHRILAALSGGTDFDLGNSPREFTRERVAGREIIMTTTNGTRALHASHGSRSVLIGSMTNLESIARHLLLRLPERLVFVCSGTLENASFEDTFAAGALVDRLWAAYGESAGSRPDDSAAIARATYRMHAGEGVQVARHARNGRRLAAEPDLAGDLPLCLSPNRWDLVAGLATDGVVRTLPG